MKNNQFIASIFAVSLLCAAQSSHADNFSTTVTLGGVTRTLTFASFDDAIKAANNPEDYKELFPEAKSTIGAFVSLDFKGVPIEFTKESNNEVTFSIPSLGVTNQSISVSASPTTSTSEITKKLNKEVENTIRGYNAAINKELAKVDSADPLGGNPSSIMGIMVENAYLQGVEDDWSTGSSPSSTENRFSGGARYGRYELSGKSVNTVTLPFGYTYKINQRQQVIVSSPFTYVDTQGANSYDAGAGFAFKQRVTDNWVLTPAVAYGLRGSFDLANVGHIASGSLTSKYTFDLDKSNPNSLKFIAGNMAGYYTTLPYQLEGYSVDPDLQSYIIKNGVIVSKNMGNSFLGRQLNMAANFTDTEYFGTPFFVDQYNELGFSMKTVNEKHWVSAFSVSANYLFSATGKSVDGYRFALGYQF